MIDLILHLISAPFVIFIIAAIIGLLVADAWHNPTA